jgi:hypothetical protein
MFELYHRHIDSDNLDFQTFIENYVLARDARKPEQIPYSELYRIVREAIREYLRTTQVMKGSSR